jgi:hypothetical protein
VDDDAGEGREESAAGRSNGRLGWVIILIPPHALIAATVRHRL